MVTFLSSLSSLAVLAGIVLFAISVFNPAKILRKAVIVLFFITLAIITIRLSILP
jgi:hypothetical protein